MALQVVAGVITRCNAKAESEVLISYREKGKHQGERWEFPGGKIELGESAFEALQRELNEELSINVQSAIELETIAHQYDDKLIELHFWQVTKFSNEPISAEGQPIRWCLYSELSNYTFPDANLPILDYLLNQQEAQTDEK